MFRQIWDVVQVLLLVWVSILVPLRVGFDLYLRPFSSSWWLELAVDVRPTTPLACMHAAENIKQARR